MPLRDYGDLQNRMTQELARLPRSNGCAGDCRASEIRLKYEKIAGQRDDIALANRRVAGYDGTHGDRSRTRRSH
jgi:hypothetical protein